MKRREGKVYDPVFFAVDADQVANYVKHVPEEWILPNYRGMSQELYDYVRPLIIGEPELVMDNGIPMQMPPFYMNRK